DGGGVRIFTRQYLRHIVDDRDAAAEAQESLRHLTTNRAAADHGQTPWQFGQLEDGFVCEIAGLFQPWNGQFHWAPAGRNHGAVEFQAFAVNFNLGGADEPGVAEINVNAELVFEPRDRIIGTDPGAQPSHPFHRFGEIDLRFGAQMNAELF